MLKSNGQYGHCRESEGRRADEGSRDDERLGLSNGKKGFSFNSSKDFQGSRCGRHMWGSFTFAKQSCQAAV